MEQRMCRSHSVITAACCTWIRTRWTAVSRNLGCVKGGRRGVARSALRPVSSFVQPTNYCRTLSRFISWRRRHAARAGQFIPSSELVGGKMSPLSNSPAYWRCAFVAMLIPSLAVTPTQVRGQAAGTVLGKVTAENGMALSGASVEVEGTKFRTLTDDQGVFRVTGMPPGQANIQVKRLGVRP